MELSVEPCHSISLRRAALTVQFSPFEWSQSLLAVGHASSVAVYSIEFKGVEGDRDKKINYKHIWECHLTNEPFRICWSPTSTLRSIDKCIQLLIGNSSHSVVQLTSDLKNENIIKEVSEHRDFVNSICYSGESGELMAASTSDDLTAKVWTCNNNQLVSKFSLTSPGMSVQFHPEDSDIFLVAERCGIIRIYSLSRNCAKMALRNSTVLDANWSPGNTFQLLAAGPQGVAVWTFGDQQPTKNLMKIGGGECVSKVVGCPSAHGIAAVISGSNSLRVVSLLSNKVPIAAHLKVLSDLSWHLTEPVIAVASDCKILFWKNESI